MEKIGVYKISNNKSNKYYIGYSCNIDKRWKRHKRELKNNTHCNLYLQRVFNKYGIDTFKFEIIHKCENKDEAKNIELEYLEDLSIRNELYNLHFNNSGGDLLSSHPNKEEIIKKISATMKLKNSKLTKEERSKKYGKPGKKNGMYGKTHTKEARLKISIANKNNKYSVGRKASLETRKKLSKIQSVLQKGKKNSFFGRKHSLETKQKMREKKLGNLPTNSRKVKIEDKIFNSLAEASRHYNVCSATIFHRIKSSNPKYINYNYYN